MTISMYFGLERKVFVSTFTKLYNTDIISEEQDSKPLAEHQQCSNKNVLTNTHADHLFKYMWYKYESKIWSCANVDALLEKDT